MHCFYKVYFTTMTISKDIIRRCLRDKRDEIESATIINRPFFYEENGNYVIVGVRHVGKSYMLYQRVHELLSQGHGWDEILFVDFDDERLAEMRTEDLDILIETHLETYGKRPYVFLDEVQNVPAWDKFVRRLANEKYHVYVTGSNAKMLSTDVATTLGGRFFIVDVYPYSFREYLTANGVELEADWAYSTQIRSSVIRLFNEYLQYGGLPEIKDFTQKRAMLSSLYQKIYLGDICSRNNIRNPKALSILIKKLAESVKQPITFNRVRNVIVSTGNQITLPTVIDYISYAEASWLLLPIGNELGKLAEKENNKKYYFIDNGILNLFLLDDKTSLLENIIAIQLCRLYGRDNVGYYSTGKEIDFILSEEKIAIQVSYSIKEPDTYDREVSPLVKFGASHPDWRLLVITMEEEENITIADTTIEVVAAYKWLLEAQP